MLYRIDSKSSDGPKKSKSDQEFFDAPTDQAALVKAGTHKKNRFSPVSKPVKGYGGNEAVVGESSGQYLVRIGGNKSASYDFR
jgi:hypothetical protein